MNLKKATYVVLAAAVAASLSSRALAADDNALNVYWKEGIRIDSADKQFQLRIGGRIQNDWVWWSSTKSIENAIGQSISDDTEFRRARLYIGGTMYKHVIFMGEYDFAGGDVSFKDVFVGVKDIPYVGMVRVGHFKEPFGMEELESDNFTTFVERNLADIFAPSRQTGIGVNNTYLDDRMTLGLGVFRLTDDNSGNSTGDNFQFAGRVTGLPFYADGGKKLVHLGFAYWYDNPDDSTLRIRQRPEVHLSPRFVDTGTFGAEQVNNVGFELAGMWGPFSLQGEYMLADVDSTATAALPNTNDPFFSGWYIQGSWVMTGEHRIYKLEDGTFSGVNPEHNFLQGGAGAFELAARFSNLDLQNEGVQGGELNDVSLGVNWYLNPNARVMLDYVHAQLHDAGSADAVVTRFQVQL